MQQDPSRGAVSKGLTHAQCLIGRNLASKCKPTFSVSVTAWKESKEAKERSKGRKGGRPKQYLKLRCFNSLEVVR